MCATPRPARPGASSSYYREAVELIRASGVDVVINLTAGMGGDFVFDPAEPGAAAAAPTWRGRRAVAHVEELRPEICTLDCGC